MKYFQIVNIGVLMVIQPLTAFLIEGRGNRYLKSGGKLIEIEFKANREEGNTNLTLDPFDFTHGFPDVKIKNGSFYVFFYVKKTISFKISGNGSGNLLIDGKSYDLPYKNKFVQGGLIQ